MLLSQIAKKNIVKSSYLGYRNIILYFYFRILLISLLFAQQTFSAPIVGHFIDYEAEWCPQSEECFLLEVANTKKSKLTGLMGRKTLARGTGMWFQFSSPEIVKMSMDNTFIPLDMIFILNKIIVEIEANVPICRLSDCPNYGPEYAIDGVIELAAGEAERLKIKVGDQVSIRKI